MNYRVSLMKETEALGEIEASRGYVLLFREE